MKIAGLLLILAAAAPSVEEPTSPSADSAPLEQPLLKFEVVPIPQVGVVTAVAGIVEVLVEGDGWVPLFAGMDVGDGTKLRVGPEATFTLSFASANELELKRERRERWFVLDTDAP